MGDNGADRVSERQRSTLSRMSKQNKQEVLELYWRLFLQQMSSRQMQLAVLENYISQVHRSGDWDTLNVLQRMLTAVVYQKRRSDWKQLLNSEIDVFYANRWHKGRITKVCGVHVVLKVRYLKDKTGACYAKKRSEETWCSRDPDLSPFWDLGDELEVKVGGNWCKGHVSQRDESGKLTVTYGNNTVTIFLPSDRKTRLQPRMG